MTILAETSNYLVEFGSGMLTIARYSDGNCLAMQGRGIAKQFRDCVKQAGPEKTIQTFIRLGERLNPTWGPLYKPNFMPRGKL